MQITITIAEPYHQYRKWRREKNKNADDTVQKFINATKQIKRIQEAYRGRHEAELWNEDIRYMRFPKGPNSVSLG
ncbi:hypothetical protein T4C_7652 [Trichinella pseudospiralis]|uniref:Uncharacterized protein n=1 Tax=Trichinella pseudospiralis TaxID=6337 RepID=A0A0V1JYI4_TRIPS|nr:hypothetical protein T4C_7652 [Trichinella pseudospiralis]